MVRAQLFCLSKTRSDLRRLFQQFEYFRMLTALEGTDQSLKSLLVTNKMLHQEGPIRQEDILPQTGISLRNACAIEKTGSRKRKRSSGCIQDKESRHRVRNMADFGHDLVMGHGIQYHNSIRHFPPQTYHLSQCTEVCARRPRHKGQGPGEKMFARKFDPGSMRSSHGMRTHETNILQVPAFDPAQNFTFRAAHIRHNTMRPCPALRLTDPKGNL